MATWMDLKNKVFFLNNLPGYEFFEGHFLLLETHTGVFLGEMTWCLEFVLKY